MVTFRCASLFVGIAIALLPTVALSLDRELNFPNNFDHAKVTLFGRPKNDYYMTGIIRFSYRGKLLSDAKGIVRIPAESWVGVEIQAESGYLEFIASLPVSGIDRLELHGATISTALIASLERVQSLRQMVLVGCQFGELDATQLSGSLELQHLSIEGADSAEQWQRLIPWLTKCPEVQFLFDGAPIQATDLKKFSNHASPIFLKANLDANAENVLDALEEIPGLVGVELAISDNVSTSELERVAQLENVELVVLNDGLFDSELIGLLAKLPKLKVLRVQGKTKIGNFLDEGFPLKNIEAVSFTRPLESELSQRFVNECLRLESLRELPNLINATASQLRQLASRNQYTNLAIYGLDESADESLVTDVIRQNPHLTRLTIANMQLTAELGSAISTCSQLEHLILSIEQFDGKSLQPELLSNLSYLNITSKKEPSGLAALKSFQGLKDLVASFKTFDPQDCAMLASIPSLESLTIGSGLCDASTAVAVGKNASIGRLVCRQYCLFNDASISELLENDGLTTLNIGGYLSETAISKLQKSPTLRRLSIHSDLIDDDATSRLRDSMQQLEHFEVRPLRLSLGSIIMGSDGLERWVPDVGRKPFDDLEGHSLDDMFGKLQLSDIQKELKGKVTLVEFWGTWCGPCLNYEPELERLHDKYHGDGLRLLSVHSRQGHEQANAYLEKHPKKWHTIIDETGEIAKSFNVPSYPSLYLFGSDGRLLVALPHRMVLERTISQLLSPRNDR